jgi:hypothetical protein
MKNIKPGQVYELRNGLTAKVVSINEPGMRPVRARLDNPGRAIHDRYYTTGGREYADWRDRKYGKSPYDFVRLIGTEE